MVAKLIDEDPEQAYAYSRVALRLASRVAAVREAAGFAAYANEKYSEALAEFRAARRMTGSAELWPVMADCERGLGRPEKALDMAGEPEVQRLDKAGQVEMRLVAAGARRDMGQLDAAIVTLQSPELASNSVQPWTARLRYAYADALLEAGREDEAREWFAKTVESDKEHTTNASDRLAELDGVEFVDAFDEDEDEDEVGENEQLVAEARIDESDESDESDAEDVAEAEKADGTEYYDPDDEEYEGDDDADDDADDDVAAKPALDQPLFVAPEQAEAQAADEGEEPEAGKA